MFDSQETRNANVLENKTAGKKKKLKPRQHLCIFYSRIY